MLRARLSPPWLICDMERSRRVLSWALNRPGYCDSRHILWRKVDDADLPVERDVRAWLEGELATAGYAGAPCLLTARRLDAFERASATAGDVTAHCIATVGLSNAERVGARHRPGADAAGSWGTINVALLVDHPLSDGALLECLSIVAEARTVAVLESGLDLPTGTASGTGTDCIAVAAEPGNTAFAGLHTAIGEAAGAATLAAVRRGVKRWLADHARRPRARNDSQERRPG